MVENKFFEQQTASSRIKASIVSEYFPSYCKIIATKHQPKEIRYIDLFAGPGIYDDRNVSTPILIGRHCQRDEYLKGNVKLIFNDNEHAAALKENFLREFPDGTFAKAPFFGNKTVGKDISIRNFLMTNTHDGEKNEKPSLLFIDPFGYKGIETLVLAEFLRNWGNEIFLFVNVKRIHPALENEKFDGLMKALFPTTLLQVKKDRRYKLSTSERLNLIINSLGKEYESIIGGRVFFTAFKFQEEDNEATSHYILHLTKGARGFDLVKQVYNDFANIGTVFDGINTYTFDAKKLENQAIELFDMNEMNISKLKDEIYEKFKGTMITAHDLYESQHTTHLYGRSHYTIALRKLAEDHLVFPTFTDGKDHRKSVLISKDCQLKFK